MPVNLIPFSPDNLRIGTVLPFDVVDPVGKLLLPRGSSITNQDRLDHLRAHSLMVDADASALWRRELAGSIASLVDQNATLKSIAALKPDLPQASARPEAATAPASLSDEVREMQMHAAVLLRDGAHLDAGWKARVEALGERVAQVARRDADGTLFLLVQSTLHESDRYSSHHALLCAVVADQVVQQLKWPPRAAVSLRLAALTMNLAMTSLQNLLAQRDGPPTPDQRRLIDAHAVRGAKLLRAAGVDDAVWLSVVEQHHEAPEAGATLEQLTPSQRLAMLLRRVDVFTAKISPRASRVGLAAPLAARDACLGEDGKPDEVGSAMIKSLGIYPPGSYVRLANEELGVVMARGAHASRPLVASVVSRDGHMLGTPALRDTRDRRFEIRGAERSSDVRVRLNHERLLALV
jgi:hypothetical protein